MSDKVDFKTRSITRDKEGYFIMMKGPSHKKDITIINVHAHNNRASKYLKQTPTELRKRHIHNYSWGFYHPLSETNRTTRK